MAPSHDSFEALQELRQYWVRIGHTGVPPINCSCGFHKPIPCIVHPKESEPLMNEDQIETPMSETMNMLVFVFMVFLVVMMTVGGAYVIVG